MLGRISITQPSDFSFQEKEGWSPPQWELKKRALRVQTLQSQSCQLYVEGSFFLSAGEAKSTDLETIISIYKTQGVETLVRALHGLFFVHIYDHQNQRHLLINNRQQLTHLYYTEQNGQLYFSDRLLALRSVLNGFEPHFPSIMNFLANGFNVSDQTQVRGVKKLLPCFWLQVDERGLTTHNHWNEQIDFQREEFSDLETHLDHYEELYRQSLRNYLEVRKPENLGTLLSGGHDTSYVMIQASQVFQKPVHAFTVHFPGWNFNEHEYAENICRKFGGVFHPVAFEPQHLDEVASLIQACEEPVLGSSLPLHVLAKEAAQHTDTLLGGDAGDTLWGEYYPVQEYHRLLGQQSLAVRRLVHQVAKTLRDTTDWERFWELEHVAQLFSQEKPYENFMQRLCTYRHFRHEYLQDLFDPQVARVAYQSSLLQIPFHAKNFGEALIEGKLYNAFYTYQSFQQTKSINASGMEFYLPYLDPDLIRFITRLPEKWVNGGWFWQRLSNSKKINRVFHKKALARYLQKEEIYNRSFDVPWFRLLEPRQELLSVLEKRLLQRGWFRETKIRELFSEFKKQRPKAHEILELKSHGYRLLALLSLEVWAMQYLDGDTRSTTDTPLEEYLR